MKEASVCLASQLPLKEAVRLWVQTFAAYGLKSLKITISAVRQPKLSKAQCRELKRDLEQARSQHGFMSDCWNSSMLQALIARRFKVDYSVKYIPQLLKRLGLSYQKAKFELNNTGSQAREHWLTKIWPSIKGLATQKKSSIYFEDEASFAMWGSLVYTWAPRGQQPTVKTRCKRKSYKMFGAIEHRPGKLVHQGCEGKLNSQSYIDLLTHLLRSTRKHIILTRDGASYHDSKAVKEFFKSKAERLTTTKLPAYSPDLNPIEQFWRKAKRLGTDLKYFPIFESLIETVDELMQTLGTKRSEIKNLIGAYST